jgi:hypothetical protein
MHQTAAVLILGLFTFVVGLSHPPALWWAVLFYVVGGVVALTWTTFKYPPARQKRAEAVPESKPKVPTCAAKGQAWGMPYEDDFY